MCPYAWDRHGGVQSHVAGLAAALGRRGHQVLVVAPGRSRLRSRVPVELVGAPVLVPANRSIAPIAFGPRVARRVAAALQRFHPDVLHVHEPLIPSTSLLALLTTKVPAVGTFHATAARSSGYAVGRPLLQRVATRLTVRAAVSAAARDFAARYFPGDYASTPNGIDFRRFAEAAPEDLGPERAILFLSRLERRKGVAVLLGARAQLRDLDVRLVVAGGGPEEARARRRAQELELPVVFLGRVDEERVARLYRGADVFCAPATGGESFGIVLLEALAAGAPVVCSDLPGFRTAVDDAALLVPPGDASALARALRGVLDDPAAAASLRRNAQKHARLFDWDVLVDDVERLYRVART